MPIEPDTLLVAGQNGGKSTFAGGLIEHILKQYDRKPGFYRVHNGSRSEIDVNIRQQMRRQGKYPKKTKKTYLIEIPVPNPDFLGSERTITLFDVGGERQMEDTEWQGVLNLDQINSAYVREMYEEDVEPKLAAQRRLDEDEQSIAFQYFVLECDNVLFVENIHSVFGSEEPSLHVDTLDSELLADKNKKALVVTACDLIPYEPEAVSRPLLGSMQDDALRDAVRERVPGDRVEMMVNYAVRDDDFDFFGVSVPCAGADDDDRDDWERAELVEEQKLLVEEDSDTNFEIRGFESVIEWLHK